jgi:hypothetical protein
MTRAGHQHRFSSGHRGEISCPTNAVIAQRRPRSASVAKGVHRSGVRACDETSEHPAHEPPATNGRECARGGPRDLAGLPCGDINGGYTLGS